MIAVGNVSEYFCLPIFYTTTEVGCDGCSLLSVLKNFGLKSITKQKTLTLFSIRVFKYL